MLTAGTPMAARWSRRSGVAWFGSTFTARSPMGPHAGEEVGESVGVEGRGPAPEVWRGERRPEPATVLGGHGVDLRGRGRGGASDEVCPSAHLVIGAERTDPLAERRVHVRSRGHVEHVHHRRQSTQRRAAGPRSGRSRLDLIEPATRSPSPSVRPVVESAMSTASSRVQARTARTYLVRRRDCAGKSPAPARQAGREQLGLPLVAVLASPWRLDR